MDVSLFHVGIIFNALVSAIVAVVAFSFIVFLFQRWTSFNLEMHAYTWIWFFTMLVWLSNAVRYFLVGFFGYTGLIVYYLDLVVQGSIFFTGPPMFYYIMCRLSSNKNIANVMAFISFIFGCVALWFVIQPGGISRVVITDFTADAVINDFSLIIFSVEIVIILVFLIYDMASRLYVWRTHHDASQLYQALYPTGLLVYVMLGSVDQAKIFVDWPIVVFRLLYIAAFLFAYLVVVEDEAHQDHYLLEAENRFADTGTQA